jgi:outer membrane biosynthesis protein TonB
MFEYPKVLGVHPVTQAPVSLNIGPFGWYVASEVAGEVLRASIGKTVLKRVGAVENVDIDEAVELLRKKAERPPRTRGRYASKKTKAKKEPKKAKEPKPKKEPEAKKEAKDPKAKKAPKPKVEVPGMKKPLTAFVAKALGERWASLDPERKAKYESDAKTAKEAYAAALAEFLASSESSREP